MSDYTIRPATAADAEGIAAVFGMRYGSFTLNAHPFSKGFGDMPNRLPHLPSRFTPTFTVVVGEHGETDGCLRRPVGKALNAAVFGAHVDRHGYAPAMMLGFPGRPKPDHRGQGGRRSPGSGITKLFARNRNPSPIHRQNLPPENNREQFPPSAS